MRGGSRQAVLAELAGMLPEGGRMRADEARLWADAVAGASPGGGTHLAQLTYSFNALLDGNLGVQINRSSDLSTA